MNYEIRKREDGKEAIFNKNGDRISQWFNWIVSDGLVKGESNYYIVAKSFFKHAIFDVDGNQISPQWFRYIYEDGLVKGESDYYLVLGDYGFAIFDLNGNMITKEWYDWISLEGLVKGESRYFIAKKDGKYAIFDENGNRISDWYDEIILTGLVKGESDYYVVIEDGEWAIFDVYGKQISSKFEYIYIDGLIKGECDYYIACDNRYNCVVYHKNGQKVSEDFSVGYFEYVKKITFNENLGMIEIKTFDEKITTIEFKPVYPYKKEEIIDYTKLLNI
jgi:hypothetical protein